MTNIKFEDDVGWRKIETQWFTPPYDEDTEIEWSYKPSYFNISYNGDWMETSKISYTYDGNYAKKHLAQYLYKQLLPRKRCPLATVQSEEHIEILFGITFRELGL